MATKAHSYRGHAVDYKITLLGQDITSYVRSIDNIDRTVDYPNLTEYRIGECSLTLNDIDGDFASVRSNNFYTRNNGRQSGYGAEILIEAGFIVNGMFEKDTIFTGQVIKVTQSATRATTKIVAVDKSQNFRQNKIEDFGINRSFALNQTKTEEPGLYHIPSALLPASEESAKGYERSITRDMIEVDRLATEGDLDTKNYILTNNGLKTEGGFVNLASNLNYPQLEIKSPYRHLPIKDTITKVLDSVLDPVTSNPLISDRSIDIPDATGSSHFSSNGRPGYNTIATTVQGNSNPPTWGGYVTDVYHFKHTNTDTNTNPNRFDRTYFLINSPPSNPTFASQIIEYDRITKTYIVIYKFSLNTEVWRFAAVPIITNGNATGQITFYILMNTDKTISNSNTYTYDPKDKTTNDIKIVQLIKSASHPTTPPAISGFVPANTTLKPQLAHYYSLGGSVYTNQTFQNRDRMLPDTKRNFIWYTAPDPNDTGLFYIFYNNSNNKFGVARASGPTTRTVIIQANIDNFGNHAGIDFQIDTTSTPHRLRGAVTFRRNHLRQSQIRGFWKNL